MQNALRHGDLSPPTWRRSASPTSGRPRSSGIPAPASPTTTPSSGRTPAPTRIAAALERSGQGDVIRRKAGLPPATYFSGGKIKWILENVDGVREAAEQGHAVFGNTDAWVLWNLTGGPDGGIHATDVTNASRTMLMNLETLDWDDELLGFFGIPRAMLPTIKPVLAPGGVRRRPAPPAAARRHPHHRRARRPAGGHGRPGLLRARARRRTPTAPATSWSSTPARSSSARSTGC